MNTISDERLAEIAESLKDDSRWAGEYLDDFARNFYADKIAALTELAERRRVEAAVEKMLAVEDGREIEIGLGYANLTRHDGATNVQNATGDNWFAALAKLVEESP